MQSYTHLSTEERICLSQYRLAGKSYRDIGELMGRSSSTICRELRRNQNKEIGCNGTKYNPAVATDRYKARRRKNSVRKPRLLRDSPLCAFVCEKLRLTWSPEEIAGVWKKEHPQEKLSVSTIYRAVRAGSLPNIAPKTHLRRKGKRKYAKRSRFNAIKPTHTIHDRPEIVESRGRVGDWEGDTVAGGVGKGYLVTLVERRLRYIVAVKVLTLNADVVADALIRALRSSGLPTLTLTLDNGSEFASYKRVEEALHLTVYFADPHAPWQRGCNECFNDCLRFFFPKGFDLRGVPDSEISRVCFLLNNRPRLCLGLRSPDSLRLALHLT